VVAFDAAGQFVRRFKPIGRDGYRPVAVVAEHTKLYVADIVAHRVDVFSMDDGTPLDHFGQVGSEPGRFYFPMGVATNDAGDIFVSDMMNGRVQVFDAQHAHLRSMGQPGNRYGDMGKPRHLAVGPDGVIYIADAEFAHVHLYNSEGQLLMFLGSPEDQPGGTPMPVGVAIAPALPDPLASLVPDDFDAVYFLFVTNSIGTKRISLFAIGRPRQ
jgi:DNA-binding beta-propeller fold protein YncE